jgi:signal transduction histidine kinase
MSFLFTLIALIIVVIANLFLAMLVFKKGKKNRANVAFGIVIILIIFWIVFNFLCDNPIKKDLAILWNRLVFTVAFIQGAALFSFATVFPDKNNVLEKFSRFLLVPFAIVFAAISLFTDLIVRQVEFLEWGTNVDPGSIYPIFLVFMPFCVIGTLVILIQKYRKSIGIEKYQLRYLFFGFALTAVLTLTTNMLIPALTGNNELAKYGPYSVVFLIGFTAYAITRYRLMDLRLIVSQGLIYLLSLAGAVGFAFSANWLNHLLPTQIPLVLMVPLTAYLNILVFQTLSRFFKKVSTKYFYYPFYNYQNVLTNLGKNLTQLLQLDKLTTLITNTLMETMKLDRTVVLLRNLDTGSYLIKRNIGFKEENGISLVKDNFLTEFLEKTQTPLVHEELSLMIKDSKNISEKRNLENLKENMARIEAALCLPLFIEKKIIGMIVLGNKVSGDPYSSEDIRLLTDLANQASVALQNAKLYSQVEDLSKNLQSKVDEQTRELKEAYEELKALDRAKSEFVSIASHQLRTPLSAIKGYISMILEDSYGKLVDRVKTPLENVYKSNERLINLVNDLLCISRIESGKIELELEKSSIEEIVTGVVDDLKITAEKKKLYLKLERPTKLLPKIMLDKDKMRQAILNLVDNAIKYTQKGGITINIKIIDSKFQILIKDTGGGMSKEDLVKLFESFSRGIVGSQSYTEGTGLGLYIAKKFVEMHNGKIWAESPGLNKGSTFYIELPI